MIIFYIYCIVEQFLSSKSVLFSSCVYYSQAVHIIYHLIEGKGSILVQAETCNNCVAVTVSEENELQLEIRKEDG